LLARTDDAAAARASKRSFYGRGIAAV